MLGGLNNHNFLPWDCSSNLIGPAKGSIPLCHFWPPWGVFGLQQPPWSQRSKKGMPMLSRKTFAIHWCKLLCGLYGYLGLDALKFKLRLPCLLWIRSQVYFLRVPLILNNYFEHMQNFSLSSLMFFNHQTWNPWLPMKQKTKSHSKNDMFSTI